MFYKFYFFLAIFTLILISCENKATNKTNTENCVEGVNKYWECLSSLAKIDLNNSSPKKQQCDDELVQYVKAQSLQGEKMNQVMALLTDKLFSGLLVTSKGGLFIESAIPENCRQKTNEEEKQKCMLQTHIQEACQREISEKG